MMKSSYDFRYLLVNTVATESVANVSQFLTATKKERINFAFFMF